jgi:thermostable 8-oxoguanine DNA glycosylase
VEEDDLSDMELRELLIGMPGIGYKTASWVVRNHRTSREVAVLDVHIIHAGRILGLFRNNETPIRDYLSLESRFVDLAMELDVPTWLLDAVMWQHMRLLKNA